MLREKSRHDDYFLLKTLWKDGELFLEDEKIVLTLNYFFIVGSFFNVEFSAHDSTDGLATALVKEGTGAWFTFKEDALLDAEGICEVK